jgi:hypothetical protein
MHLRDLSTLALLESEENCVHSISDTVSDSDRTDNLTDLSLDFPSGSFLKSGVETLAAMDNEASDGPTYDIPDVAENEDWDFMPSKIRLISPGQDPTLSRFVARFDEGTLLFDSAINLCRRKSRNPTMDQCN